MASANGIFQRIEKKYRLTPQQRAALIPVLKEHMELDRYGKSTITSLYLDTPDNDLICRSLEKPLYKEKIRIRRYGAIDTMTGNNDVFLEIKKKYKDVVYKRRVNMTWNAACAFLKGMDYVEACQRYPLTDSKRAQDSLSVRSQQIAREIIAFGTIHRNLTPSMSIAYDRTALRLRTTANDGFGAGAEVATDLAGQGELRITFDDNIRYIDLRNPTTKHNGEQLLPMEGESLMEVKMTGAMPLWLSHAFADLGIRPASFTKIGNAYKVTHTPQKCAPITAGQTHYASKLATAKHASPRPRVTSSSPRKCSERAAVLQPTMI